MTRPLLTATVVLAGLATISAQEGPERQDQTGLTSGDFEILNEGAAQHISQFTADTVELSALVLLVVLSDGHDWVTPIQSAGGSQRTAQGCLLGFTPQTLDERRHPIDVRVKRPGVDVRARRSYVAGAR
jgi:hypothetical protein